MQVKKQHLEPDVEQWTGSKSGKAVYCHPAYFANTRFAKKTKLLYELNIYVTISGTHNLHDILTKTEC